MKSFLTLAFILMVLVAVVGGGGLLFYLSAKTEFSRKDRPRGMSLAPVTVPGMSRDSKPAAPARPPQSR